MHFSEIFIRRPVLSSVLAAFILLLGFQAIFSLPVRQYPEVEETVVTITTVYPGAAPELIQGFITAPIAAAVATTENIDYVSSQSRPSASVVSVQMKLGADPDVALTEVLSKVQSVTGQLPDAAEDPIIVKGTGQTFALMYLAALNPNMTPEQLTEYLDRVIRPRMSTIEGVAEIEIIGAQNYAMRVWIDPLQLAARGVTASEVLQAIQAANFLSAPGQTEGEFTSYSITLESTLQTPEAFGALPLKAEGDAVVRLRDVARIELAAENSDTIVTFDGQRGTFIGIYPTPAANPLTVSAAVIAELPSINATLPEGMEITMVYDSTETISASIEEVFKTIAEAIAIVVVVILLFLGSFRSVLMPVVTIPLSLIGVCAVLLALGYSINLLSLLAMVLAIGLVVDDAIIVVENVNRHLDEGMQPVPAAIAAARELGSPIIAMTIVLIAVYVPIGFQGGLTGALFTEFAFTLVGAVTVSAVVALTLSPMMCSRFLKPHDEDRSGWQERLTDFIDRTFERLRGRYERWLHGSLGYIPVTATFAVIVLGSIYFLYAGAKHELAPQEDAGIIISSSQPAPNATLQQKLMYSKQIYQIMAKHPETEHVFQIDAPGTSIAGMVFKPWDQRKKTTNELQPVMQEEFNSIAGVRAAAFQIPPLPGSQGLPVQFVLETTDSFDRLNDVAQDFLQQAVKSGMFIFLDSDLKIDTPQSIVQIDRDKTAQLGLKMSDVGAALGGLLGGGYVNYFSLDQRSYKVIPQVQQKSRLNPDQLLNYYVGTVNGVPIPLSTIATITTKTIPESINHFQQLNSATIQGVTTPGVAQADALAFLQNLAKRTLPQGYSVDFGGLSRQYIQESSAFVVTFGFALIIIYLALAALFESFRDPVIILVSVPMSIAGALIFISVGIGGASLNIYTEVGLVTLMGLNSTHGILIVEFANELQQQGKSKREAIEAACGIRLRPILMTTAAMVLGVMPLIIASGAGAVSRFNMGLVIASGLAIGTLFTLFVVPAVYMMISEDHSKRSQTVEA